MSKAEMRYAIDRRALGHYTVLPAKFILMRVCSRKERYFVLNRALGELKYYKPSGDHKASVVCVLVVHGYLMGYLPMALSVVSGIYVWSRVKNARPL